MVTREVINTLKKFTVCDVSDALVKYGHKDGGYIPNLTMQSSQSSVSIGSAYTVIYASKDDPRPEIKLSYIDALPENSILMLGLPLSLQTTFAPYTKVNNALYGGLMSTRANYLKASGSIVFGRIRDVDEHNDLDYPVWSYGVGSTAPTPVVKIVGINVPLEIKIPSINNDYDVVTVNPDDIIMADKNGVVKIPHDILDGVLEYIPKRVDADTHVSDDIKAGKPAKEAQKYWRSKI